MRILAIYIFKEEGIPLLSRFYDRRARTIDGLVAPFLASINKRITEVTGSDMQQISLSENIFMIFEQFAGIIVAIVVNNIEEPQFELNLVARRFYKRYHRDLSKKGWSGKVDQFQDFIQEMEQLLDIESEFVINQIPHEVLDTFVMSDYDPLGQTIIRHLIQKVEITRDDISRMGLPEERSMEIIYDLIQKGFLGSKENNNGKIIYFRLD